ncbi:MAG: response regulator [Pseudomonadota bacterium]|nr:response regulator [Pseudomonadota bacterium]
MHILLIDDHAELVLSLWQSLKALGMEVETSHDGNRADALLREHSFDVVVLDLVLPGMSGLDVLHRMRERGDKTPVLMLTASGDICDRVQGLNDGADDYLSKPFELSELEARLRALHRRAQGAAQATLRVGRLHFDTISRRFAVDSRPLPLPPREHDLLESLAERPGRPVSKIALAERLCTEDAVLSHDALEVYVHRLRRRLNGSGATIHTLRGLGYMLDTADERLA